jgi:hypothetical protein
VWEKYHIEEFHTFYSRRKTNGVRSRRMRRAGNKKCIQNFTRKNLKGI